MRVKVILKSGRIDVTTELLSKAIPGTLYIAPSEDMARRASAIKHWISAYSESRINEVLGSEFDMIIIDDLSHFKNPKKTIDVILPTLKPRVTSELIIVVDLKDALMEYLSNYNIPESSITETELRCMFQKTIDTIYITNI